MWFGNIRSLGYVVALAAVLFVISLDMLIKLVIYILDEIEERHAAKRDRERGDMRF